MTSETLNKKEAIKSRMFDRGIISFTNNKHLLVSDTFSHNNLERLHLQHDQIISDLPVIGREEYMEYHRNKIFIHA